MKKPVLKKENIDTLLETKYVNVADLRFEGLSHYYGVSRRPVDKMIAVLSDEDFKKLIPDAVSCFVIVKAKDKEPGLLLTKEFRYPVGQFLLSPPAGLIDKADLEEENPLVKTAIREIKEETGLDVKESDRVFEVSPLVFSSPGITDECNALVCAVVETEEAEFSSAGIEGTECIGDYRLVGKQEALRILKQGKDDEGIFYSVYTWMALMYFVSGLWELDE